MNGDVIDVVGAASVGASKFGDTLNVTSPVKASMSNRSLSPPADSEYVMALPSTSVEIRIVYDGRRGCILRHIG